MRTVKNVLLVLLCLAIGLFAIACGDATGGQTPGGQTPGESETPGGNETSGEGETPGGDEQPAPKGTAFIDGFVKTVEKAVTAATASQPLLAVKGAARPEVGDAVYDLVAGFDGVTQTMDAKERLRESVLLTQAFLAQIIACAYGAVAAIGDDFDFTDALLYDEGGPQYITFAYSDGTYTGELYYGTSGNEMAVTVTVGYRSDADFNCQLAQASQTVTENQSDYTLTYRSMNASLFDEVSLSALGLEKPLPVYGSDTISVSNFVTGARYSTDKPTSAQCAQLLDVFSPWNGSYITSLGERSRAQQQKQWYPVDMDAVLAKQKELCDKWGCPNL